MSPGPTDLEAWLALQAYIPELDKVRRPKELKEAMNDVVSRTWDMSESRLDFVDFGVIWIDPHYRKICNRFAEIGPGRETFDIATYRTLKTSRLEGHWDVLLENIAGWIETFAKEFRGSVTLDDYEKLLNCMPPNQNLKNYRSNVRNLFWAGAGSNERSDGFLAKLPPADFEDAYNIILSNPPDDSWNLKLIMNQIHDKGIVCKSVMLHVGFWFNPDLEEPANRANVKPPMYHHLKLAFSKYEPEHPSYENDLLWKPHALMLQRIVLKFTLEWWPRSNAIIGNLGMLRDMSVERYSDYISTYFWNSLLREVRSNTNVPFRHLSLERYKALNDIPHSSNGPPQNHNDIGMSMLRGQVDDIIRDEYSDGHSLDSEGVDENLEVRDKLAFTSRYNSKTGLRFSQTDSAPLESLAVESEDERDIIHVRTPSPSHSNLSKRRKMNNSNEDLRYLHLYDEEYTSSERIERMIVKLIVAPQRLRSLLSTLEQNGQPRRFARKRPANSSSNSIPDQVRPLSPTASAPSNTFTTAAPASTIPGVADRSQNRSTTRSSLNPHTQSVDFSNTAFVHSEADSSNQSLPWRSVERETARRALDECDGIVKSTSLRPQALERRTSVSTQPSYLSRNHSLPTTNSTPTPKPPTPFTAPHPLSHSSLLAQTSSTGSLALSTNKTEQAILVLQDEYGDVLKIEDMLTAIKFLKTDLEAGIFLNLKPGALRNAWLLDSIKDGIRNSSFSPGDHRAMR